MKTLAFFFLLSTGLAPLGRAQAQPGAAAGAVQVQTADGLVAGVTEKSGVRSFKGLPFAQPPVGPLRWQEPRPVQPWPGVRPATAFGPKPMQRPIFGDMNSRAAGMGEDCLYLNVWTPAKSGRERLPVLVYFYGGGFVAGDASEPRYDGESMAQKGIVALTVNYRLGVFGFLAHPELTQESAHHASGNYGLLDQQAALRWVRQNIAAFGGDPQRVTIAGESAGSFSVSAQMASPLAKGLIAGAIGESGSLLSLRPLPARAQAEALGVKFAAGVGAASLAALRAMPAEQLLAATANPAAPAFSAIVDGYFFPQAPAAIFQAGQQARVPLLGGWNSEEMTYRALLGTDPPTPENYRQAVQKLYGGRAEEALKLYPGTTDAEVVASATALASDRFIAYSTWKWLDVHGKTGGQPVYRYFFARARPAMRAELGDAAPGLAGGVVQGPAAAALKTPPASGAVHSAEIEYALGNLATNHVYAWTPDDYQVSDVMERYFANFIKTGNPNGPGLPSWPAANHGRDAQLLRLDVVPRAEAAAHPGRYPFLEQAAGQ